MASISIDNTSKRPPRWLRKLARVVNIGVIPVAVTSIKGLWHGSEAQLNQILLIITVSVPGLIEVAKLLTTDDGDEAAEQ